MVIKNFVSDDKNSIQPGTCIYDPDSKNYFLLAEEDYCDEDVGKYKAIIRLNDGYLCSEGRSDWDTLLESIFPDSYDRLKYYLPSSLTLTIGKQTLEDNDDTK